MTDREVMQQVLEALERYQVKRQDFDRFADDITALRTALEQQQADPVAWMVYTQDGQSVYVTDNPTDIQEGQRALPLYTIQPQRQWVGLTKVQQDDFADAYGSYEAVCAIEQALKERNI